MSLPISNPSQLSIRFFFKSKSPKHTPTRDGPPASQSAPPSSDSASASATTTTRPPPPPPPPPPLPPQHSPSTTTITAPPRPTIDAPIPPLSAILPPEACVRPIFEADVPALRRINTLLLPVNYPDSFYRRAASPDDSGRFSRVITWAHDGEEAKVVGGVVCTVEASSSAAVEADVAAPRRAQDTHNIYIRSLCLLSPYRRMGLIGAALDNVIATALADPALAVRTVTAHVWTDNEDAMRWYDGRGFERQGPPIPGYYLKLRPDSAWLVRRSVDPATTPNNKAPRSEATRPANASSAPPTPPAPPSSSNSPNGVTGPGSSPLPSRTQSFQTQRPETEWNDLPTDMAPGRPALLAPRMPGSEPASGASSRSSSAVRKKKDRSYPAAAFGN